MPKGEHNAEGQTAKGKQGFSRLEPIHATTDKDRTVNEVTQSFLNMIYGANLYFQGKGIGSVSDSNIIKNLADTFVEICKGTKHSKDDQLTHLSKVPPDLKEQANRLK